jgi:hypothetical protein
MCNLGSLTTYVEHIWMEVRDFHTNDDRHVKTELGNSVIQKVIFHFLLLE